MDKLLAAAAAWRGWDLVRRNLYSPIPQLPVNEAAASEPQTSLAGIRLDLDGSLSWLEQELSAYIEEFRGRVTDDLAFALTNNYYRGFDATLLYAMVRRFKPARMLEVGAGFSTRISAAACLVNGAEGHPTELISVDPHPRTEIEQLAGVTRVELRSANDLPLGDFLSLRSGDILFIDTSHVVKRGSEVNRLVLEVLPRIALGVVVHIHDIFLPYDYPLRWYRYGTFLTEQFLVQAFLTDNQSYEILIPSHALARSRREHLRRIIPFATYTDADPASFWMRRC